MLLPVFLQSSNIDINIDILELIFLILHPFSQLLLISPSEIF